MRYGYYIANARSRHGDPEFARLARLLWRRYGHRHPARVDGVSVLLEPSGFKVTLIVRDLFDVGHWGRAPYPAFEVPLCRVRSLV